MGDEADHFKRQDNYNLLYTSITNNGYIYIQTFVTPKKTKNLNKESNL